MTSSRHTATFPADIANASGRETTNRVVALFVVYMCIATILDYRLVFILNCLFGLKLSTKRETAPKPPLVGGVAVLFMIALSLVVGLFSSYSLVKVFRDFVYYLMPFSYCAAAGYFAKRLMHEDDVLTSLMYASFAVAVITFAQGALSASTSTGGLSVNSFTANEMIAYPVVFLLIRPSGWNFFKKKPFMAAVIVAFCLAMTVLTLSRTTLLFILLILVIAHAASGNSAGTIGKIIFISFIVAILTLCLVPESTMNSFVGKITNSFTEMSSVNIWTQDTIVQNWRGYELDCAFSDFDKADVFTKLFGRGFGYLLPVNGLEYLVTDEAGGINTLHNGYISVLIKNGLFGLALLVIFFAVNIARAYRVAKQERSYSRQLALAVAVAIAVCSYFITGVFSPSAMYVFVVPFYLFASIEGSGSELTQRGQSRNERNLRNND